MKLLVLSLLGVLAAICDFVTAQPAIQAELSQCDDATVACVTSILHRYPCAEYPEGVAGVPDPEHAGTIVCSDPLPCAEIRRCALRTGGFCPSLNGTFGTSWDLTPFPCAFWTDPVTVWKNYMSVGTDNEEDDRL